MTPQGLLKDSSGLLRTPQDSSGLLKDSSGVYEECEESVRSL
jgi:hypothetical protein